MAHLIFHLQMRNHLFSIARARTKMHICILMFEIDVWMWDCMRMGVSESYRYTDHWYYILHSWWVPCVLSPHKKHADLCAPDFLFSYTRGCAYNMSNFVHCIHFARTSFTSYKQIEMHMHGTFKNSSSHLALKVMAFCTDTHSHTHTHKHTNHRHPHHTHTHATTHSHMYTHTQTLRQTDR